MTIWKADAPAPDPEPLTEPPSIPKEITPDKEGQDLCTLLGIPFLPALTQTWLDSRRESAPELVLRVPASPPRTPGPHVSHTGASRERDPMDLCARSLWHSYDNERTGEKGATPDPGTELMWLRGHITEALLARILDFELGRFGFRQERNLPCDYHHPSGAVLTGELDILQTGIALPGSIWEGEEIEFIIDSKDTKDKSLDGMRGPKASNVHQQQAYLESPDNDARFALLAYLSRKRVPRWFFVPKNPELVLQRTTEVLAIRALPEAPEVLPPKIVRVPNKGPDTVKVGLAWQCRFCEHIDLGCRGSLRPEHRPDGETAIWGHIQADGSLKPKVDKSLIQMLGEDMGREQWWL